MPETYFVFVSSLWALACRPLGLTLTFGFGLLAPPQLQTRDQSGAPEHTEDCGEPLLPAAKRARTQSSFPKREVEVDGL